MQKSFFASVIAATLLVSSPAFATVISYSTSGSTLSCNGVAGCNQESATRVSLGGLTFTYNIGSGSGVTTPSIINFGNIVATGTSSNVSVSGLLLSINVDLNSPGSGISGTLPNGSISGTISANNSGATILFSPDNTTTAFGTLPGVDLTPTPGDLFVFQVLNPTLGLDAPNVGEPSGQTSIQGTVSEVITTSPPGTVPEPSGVALLGIGLAGLIAVGRRFRRAA